jgi:glutamate racemase
MKASDHSPCPRFFLLPLAVLLIVTGCSRNSDIKDVIRNDRSNFYYIDFENYPAGNSSLPVGVFDSGTGGLSVLADIVKEEGLANESFIFLGDLANMPYGSYSLEDNTSLLIEHVMKDVQFLLGNKYYQRGDSKEYMSDKSPVKAIVIACNTATAYALDTVRNFLEDAGVDLDVIGVIDAGAHGAFGSFSPGENGSIAVLATDGTVKSGAYPAAIRSINIADGQEEVIQVFQQAGIGIAESIDENRDAIDRKATVPRPEYRGPSETGEGDMFIDPALWARYDFDLDNGALLFEGDITDPHNIQINSVENYIKFHMVSLMEKIRKTEGAQPLNSVVLACTHYPFFSDTFRSELLRLRDLCEDGEYIYRRLISEDFIIVNPASVVAEQLYTLLSAKNLLNTSGDSAGEFYISVPNLRNRKASLREDGSFTYEYKYGRRAGEIQEYVKAVPFSRNTIPGDILERLQLQIPAVYDMMAAFDSDNPKTQFLTPEERIVK